MSSTNFLQVMTTLRKLYSQIGKIGIKKNHIEVEFENTVKDYFEELDRAWNTTMCLNYQLGETLCALATSEAMNQVDEDTKDRIVTLAIRYEMNRSTLQGEA